MHELDRRPWGIHPWRSRRRVGKLYEIDAEVAGEDVGGGLQEGHDAAPAGGLDRVGRVNEEHHGRGSVDILAGLVGDTELSLEIALVPTRRKGHYSLVLSPVGLVRVEDIRVSRITLARVVDYCSVVGAVEDGLVRLSPKRDSIRRTHSRGCTGDGLDIHAAALGPDAGDAVVGGQLKRGSGEGRGGVAYNSTGEICPIRISEVVFVHGPGGMPFTVLGLGVLVHVEVEIVWPAGVERIRGRKQNGYLGIDLQRFL